MDKGLHMLARWHKLRRERERGAWPAQDPITLEDLEPDTMVLASDGFYYELSALREWCRLHVTSPVTREVLREWGIQSDRAGVNVLLRGHVERWGAVLPPPRAVSLYDPHAAREENALMLTGSLAAHTWSSPAAVALRLLLDWDDDGVIEWRALTQRDGGGRHVLCSPCPVVDLAPLFVAVCRWTGLLAVANPEHMGTCMFRFLPCDGGGHSEVPWRTLEDWIVNNENA